MTMDLRKEVNYEKIYKRPSKTNLQNMSE